MASPSYRQAVRRYFRNYVFAPRYRAEEVWSARTSDGVRLAGARLAGPPDAFATVVLVHGFVHSARTPGIHAFARALSRQAEVIVPELRGHGGSAGECTLGREEPRDVEAAVAFAREARPGVPVVTVGVSLGGASALLHAGTYGGVAGVVAISSPAWWGAWDTPATRRLRRYAMTTAGRVVAARLLGTRVAARCEGVPDARDIAAAISPAFGLIVHDPADHYFGEEHPRTLYEWLREPKALWLEEGAGHGTDLLTPPFTARLLAELRRSVVTGGGSVG